MLSDAIAAHFLAALSEAIRDDKAVSYAPAALVDAKGVGRIDVWDLAEIAAEAAEMHRQESTAWCSWCGRRHIKGQGQWELDGCPDEEISQHWDERNAG